MIRPAIRPAFVPLALALALATPAQADVLQGTSDDPVGELNDLYTSICRWEDGETIPTQVIDITNDGVDDYLLTYDLACRGQANAFTGTAGTARQIWVSLEDGSYLRILDANALGITFETRDGTDLIIVENRGDYCMTAQAAPCFLTLTYADNALDWAEPRFQHPSMNTRLRMKEDAQNNAAKETSND